MTRADVGSPAPQFAARNQHGQLVSGDDLRGAAAVLVFYPWAYSRICGSELSQLRADQRRYRDAGVRLLAISCDAMFSLRAYADAEHIDFDLLSDHWPHGATAQAFGVFDAELGVARRGTFVLDAAGTVVHSEVIDIAEARDLAGLLHRVVPRTGSGRNAAPDSAPMLVG